MPILDLIVTNFWLISGTILGFCFVGVIVWEHLLRARRIEAADKFHSIVTNTFKDLYSVSGDITWSNSPDFDINIILAKHFPAISAAVTDYHSFVKNKQAFLNDWDIYRGKDRNGMKADQNYMQYTGAKFDGLPIESREVIFHNNVTNLLKHAKT